MPFHRKIKIPFKIKIIILLIFISMPLVAGVSFWIANNSKSELQKKGTVGEYILNNDFSKQSIISISENKDNYNLVDSVSGGPVVKYATMTEEQKKEQEEKVKNEIAIDFPKNYSEPISIKLDEQRIIQITDKNGNNFSDKLIVEEIPLNVNDELKIKNQEANREGEIDDLSEKEPDRDEALDLEKENQTQQIKYLKYQDKEKRKSLYYAFQKDDAQRKLKQWIIYDEPKNDSGNKIQEYESYSISNAKIKLNEKGEVEVYYFGDQEVQNEKTMAEVDSSLMARAQRTLQKELGEDILNSNNHTPDFIIPAPYYINKDQQKIDLNWEVDQKENTVSIKFNPTESEYPIALDPTVQFTAPGQNGSGVIISPNAVDLMGTEMVDGDLNHDGINDLIVGNGSYNGNQGRVYIFLGGVDFPVFSMSGADIKIDGGATGQFFGSSLLTEDFNSDGRIDLVVGEHRFSTSTGRVYVFYNDGSIPTTTSTADVVITGEAISYFSHAMTSGDFNNDGKNDLVIGADAHSSWKGRIYIFYNDGSLPATAAGADIIINGEINSYLGEKMAMGDLNNDGKNDLIATTDNYGSNAGRVYIFYNDGSIPSTADTADIIIDGEASSMLGISVIAKDLNYDGSTDLAVGASYANKVYIFYNDGSIPIAAASADLIITGEVAGDYFGTSLAGGDFNNDGKIDLVVGASGYGANLGRIYIFYNDGSTPTTAATADLNITGEGGANYLGKYLFMGEFSGDSSFDLLAISTGYSTIGRLYVFHNDGSIPSEAGNADKFIHGEAGATFFGSTMVSGDFNSDGFVDLAVGAYGFAYSIGKVYIFYGGITSTNSNSANVMINGLSVTNYFGNSLLATDINNDNRTDLIVGSYGYLSQTGRVYIFYNDGSIPTLAANADVIITGETTGNKFGISLTSGDFDNDGKNDLAVGAYTYATNRGRVYVFYNDGSMPTAAATADAIITGEGNGICLGYSLASGDLNNDSRVDLIVGSSTYNYVYIFYNDGSYPSLTSGADIRIAGEATSYFGSALESGDLNGDGKVDLVAGAYHCNGVYYGKIYVFYNDGSMPTTADAADVVITGESSNGSFGKKIYLSDYDNDNKKDIISSSSILKKAYIFYSDEDYPINASNADIVIDDAVTDESFSSGDFNNDGRIDLAVGGLNNYVYIFYSQTGQSDVSGIGVENNYDYLGRSMICADFNNDGKNDLVVSGMEYNSSMGRVYIFYNDDKMAGFTDMADVTISGESSSNKFGSELESVDLNDDGKKDLIVGASQYASNAGRVYIFYNDGAIPAVASEADVIIAGSASSSFGYSMTSGDFNADNKIDLVVGAYTYSSSVGRVHIFYNDGTLPTTAATADMTITGETGAYFGCEIISGNFNGDSATDLAVGGYGYTSNTGRVYVFYNDGSLPTTAGTADVIITGEAVTNYFGNSMTSGDFNNDGKIDLAVGAYIYSSTVGRVYIFYNDGVMPTTAATADVIIAGETSSYFGFSLASTDFNADNKTDLIVGGTLYNSSAGRVYVFCNDGDIPTSAVNADFVINGETANGKFGNSMLVDDLNNDGKNDLIVSADRINSAGGRVYVFYNDGEYSDSALDAADHLISGNFVNNEFGFSLAAGDLNNDGKTDLVVGATGGGYGRVYIFYNNNSSFPVSGNEADEIIEGESGSVFGSSLLLEDFNSDNKIDLIVGAPEYNARTGRIYVFYNDGTLPIVAGRADIIITGEVTNSYFGHFIISADLNSDGKNDLVAGAYGYSSTKGRAYIFYNDGSVPTTAATADVIISGELINNSRFGYSMTSGDFNSDNKVDLVIGAYSISSAAGRVYIFYNDGSIPTTADTADVIINGEASSHFGYYLTSGDLNSDNKTDLIVSGRYYDSSTGRVYVFYNDGSIPTTADTADLIITGSAQTTYLGNSLAVGDLNSDGKKELVVSNSENSNAGRVYIFRNNGTIGSSLDDAELNVSGASTAIYFGKSLVIGDFDGDLRNELVVGAYNQTGGKIYFYNIDAAGTLPNYVNFYGNVHLGGGVVLQ